MTAPADMTAGPVRVFVATTAGLVAVQRITEEDPEVNSVVCLAGKAVSLPISAAYEAFVRNPTGVIQRHFGHPAYRVDVSATIDEGYSWQLGLFAAHALVAAGRLADPADTAAPALIATGEVDRDLNVLAVNHMDEKFGDLDAKLAGLSAPGVLLAVPAENGQAVAAHLMAAAGAAILAPVETVTDLLGRLGLATTTEAEAAPREPAAPAAPVPEMSSKAADKTSRTGRIAAGIALLVIFAAGAGAAGVTYSPALKDWAAQWIPALKPQVEAVIPPPTRTLTPTKETKAMVPVKPAPAPAKPAKPVAKVVAPPAPAPVPVMGARPKPKPAPEIVKPPAVSAPKDIIEASRKRNAPLDRVDIRVIEQRAPRGYGCGDVRAGRVAADVADAPQHGPGGLRPSVLENLCMVEIKATPRDDGMYLLGSYLRWSDGAPGTHRPDKIINLGPRPGEVRWTVDIPDRLERGAVFQIVIFSAYGAFELKPKIVKRLGRHPRNPKTLKLRKRLRKNGIAITATRYRIIPKRLAPRRPPPPRPGQIQGRIQDQLQGRYPPPRRPVQGGFLPPPPPPGARPFPPPN